MKKILIFLITTILLSACAESGSIGVIGGADGPTSIIVSKYKR